MAIVKTGSVVSGISGSIGGTTFVGARRGLVMRPRPTIRAASSPFLAVARGRLANVRNTWATLTDLQRDGWKTLARTTNTTNRLGVSSPTTGFNLFTKYNLELFLDSDDYIEDAPTTGITGSPRSVSADFEESGDFTVSANPPDGFGSALFLVYGFAFWRTTPSKEPCRLVHLTSLVAPSIDLDVKTEWEEHFGSMVEDQRFCIGVAARTSPAPRSLIIVVRDQVSA